MSVKYGKALAFLDQTHGDTGHRRLHRHTGIHQRQRGTANEAMDEEPLDSVMSDTTRMAYGNLSFARQHRLQHHDGQTAMADFTALGTGFAAGFTHGVGREVVVQHEGSVRVPSSASIIMRVAGTAQSGGDQRLGFTTGEQRGAVGFGSTPTCISSARTVLVSRPSIRGLPLRMLSRTVRYFRSSKQLLHFIGRHIAPFAARSGPAPAS
jgi:hypothetical protein